MKKKSLSEITPVEFQALVASTDAVVAKVVDAKGRAAIKNALFEEHEKARDDAGIDGDMESDL